MALFFVSCGSSGSQEYKDWKKVCSKLEKAIDKAKSCEELEDAYEAFDDATELLTDKDYAKGQEITDEEENMNGWKKNSAMMTDHSSFFS